MSQIYQRKRDHIELSHRGPVGLDGDSGLWDEVQLVHQALPERKLSDIHLDQSFFGKRLNAPILLTGMTGGPPETREINRSVARACQRLGLAFGVGSQRVMLKAPESVDTFRVRDVAPDIPILANIGINQARDLGIKVVKELVESIEADALAIHLNPAMELIQPDDDADHDFRDGYQTICQLVDALEGKVIVKECGCGLAPQVVERLIKVGVSAVDVSGVGGTSWVKLEALRNEGDTAELGHLLQGWGLPTAAAIALSAHFPIQKVASGGISNPLIAIKALALGADLVGLARPALQALLNDGEEGLDRYLSGLILGMKKISLLVGASSVQELSKVPRVIGPQLRTWLEQCPSQWSQGTSQLSQGTSQ